MVGYVQQSFLLTFYVFSAGVVLAMLLCLPDYPFYNTHPLPWQQPVKPAPSEGEGTGVQADGAGVVAADEVVGGGSEDVVETEEQEEDVVVVKKKKKGSKKPAATSVRKQ